jgi:hypothetical protein
MMFRTVMVPSRQHFHVRVQNGGRGMYFNDFEYELTDDPTAEIVSVGFAPDLGNSFSRELWPDVEIGAHLGATEALNRSSRLCCVRITMLFAKMHDVDTTPRAVQRRVNYCVYEDVVRFTQPVPELHPAWLTSDVVAVARGIRAAGHSGGVPILTDALLEAGCDDPLVIEHLRTCTDHGPCCWVAEMVCARADAR